jgi:uncharacterized protein (TIGR03118 family)
MRIKNWAPHAWVMPLTLLMLAATPTLLYSAPMPGNSFVQHNLVSDIPGLASYTDPSLANPWGIAFSGTSPFWIADNHTGLATLYNTFGVKQGLVVTIPPLTGSAPTGQVFNPNSGDFGGNRFIFSTEDGTIAAWMGGTTAALTYSSSAGAIYKGLALANSGGTNYLYATDFHNNAIDVFDSSFAKVSLAGSFTDPNLPAGYAPFGIQQSGGQLFVTYALQDADAEDDVAGPGHGFVDVFNTDGTLVQRLVSMGSLNSPWGMAWAPAGFGQFSGDLLIGNFGDGTINVFDPNSGMWLAQLQDSSGNPLVNLGLWDLKFGNGGSGGFAKSLYFTAGIPGNGNVEDHGLFGTVSAVPEPGTLTLLGSGFVSLLGYGLRRGKRKV